MSEEQKAPASKMVCGILAILLPTLCLHRMMMGYKQWWQRLLLACIPIVCPFMVILGWVDAYKIFTGKMTMLDGRDLV